MKKKIKKIAELILKPSYDQEVISTKSMQFLGGLTPINETSPNDVFIVGFPKSGNTLMQHIIGHLFYGLNEESSRTVINLLAPDIYTNSHYFRVNDTCFFKSHDWPNPRYKRVIYMIRDGREAMLSYFHMKKNLGKEISLKDLYSGKVEIFGGQWHQHIEQWEKNPYKADILWVKYEDLRENKKEVILKICDFLGILRSDFQIEQVVYLTSLDYMKKLEKRPDWAKLKKGKFEEGKSFVRQGKIDSYKQEVSEELIDKFEAQNKVTLEKYYL